MQETFLERALVSASERAIIDQLLQKWVGYSTKCLHFSCLQMEHNRKTFSDLILRRECFRLIELVLC